MHICPLQFSSSDWVSAYVAASLVGLLPWVGSDSPHGCPEQVSQKCCSEDNPISLYKARSNPLVQLVLCRKRIKSPSNCIFCQAQPNPCYSWAKLTLSSISLAIWAAQHWIYAAQHICAVLHVYGLHNIAYELHNLSYGLHNIAYRLQNIAYGLHNIACRLHNIVPLGK